MVVLGILTKVNRLPIVYNHVEVHYNMLSLQQTKIFTNSDALKKCALILTGSSVAIEKNAGPQHLAQSQSTVMICTTAEPTNTNNENRHSSNKNCKTCKASIHVSRVILHKEDAKIQ